MAKKKRRLSRVWNIDQSHGVFVVWCETKLSVSIWSAPLHLVNMESLLFTDFTGGGGGGGCCSGSKATALLPMIALRLRGIAPKARRRAKTDLAGGKGPSDTWSPRIWTQHAIDHPPHPRLWSKAGVRQRTFASIHMHVNKVTRWSSAAQSSEATQPGTLTNSDLPHLSLAPPPQVHPRRASWFQIHHYLREGWGLLVRAGVGGGRYTSLKKEGARGILAALDKSARPWLPPPPVPPAGSPDPAFLTQFPAVRMMICVILRLPASAGGRLAERRPALGLTGGLSWRAICGTWGTWAPPFSEKGGGGVCNRQAGKWTPPARVWAAG